MEAMRTALVDTADEMLGRTKRSQPDWFLESEDTIRPFSKQGMQPIPSGYPLVISKS